jgi:ABC-type glycerol-3-phosphate transport system substrate-binding protein
MILLAATLQSIIAVKIPVRLVFVVFLIASQPIFATRNHAAQSPADWQSEWDQTLKAAEQEAQVVYSGCGSHDYLAEFQKKFPKIKVESVSASFSEVISRIMAERRAGKYLTDVIRFGLTSAHSFYRAKVLQPIATAFILPEVKDQSKWWQKKHHYSDAEGKYLFVPPPASTSASPATIYRWRTPPSSNPTGIC